MDKELRPKITWHQLAVSLMAVVLGVASIVILGCALFGCATVIPYVGTDQLPSSHEEFVRWTDEKNETCEKKLFVDNPMGRAILAHFECGTPIGLDVPVPARSTRVESIFGDHGDANRDACRLKGFDIIR